MSDAPRYTAFIGPRRLAAGDLPHVALAVKRAVEEGAREPIHLYEDGSGRIVDLDVRGSDEAVLARLPWPAPEGTPRGRGRPRLGVVAREVTLLPRHWDWLAAQPGGASVALRKLVDEARRAHAPSDRIRAAQEAAYRFLSSVAGDAAGFEEATRALFRNDRARFTEQIADWPRDVRAYATRLAFPD